MRARQVAALVVCLLLAFVLVGCQRDHYTRSDAASYIKEVLPGAKLEVGRDHTEVENDDGYTDLIWQAYIKQNPELVFEVRSHKYYGSEWTAYDLQTTFHTVYGAHYYAQYNGAGTGLAAAEIQAETAGFPLEGYFTTTEDIRALFGEAKAFLAYNEAQDYPCNLSVRLYYTDPLTETVDDDTDAFIMFRYENGSLTNIYGEATTLGELEAELTETFALYAADYRLALDQFTAEELEMYVAASRQRFAVVRGDGTQVLYTDLALSCYGYGLSFGGLYEVLQREGFAPDGTAEHFSFTGADGKQYTFAYSFNDYVFETSSGSQPGYYYLVDGEEEPMPSFFYNHLKSGQLEEMTGLQFVSLYGDEGITDDITVVRPE